MEKVYGRFKNHSNEYLMKIAQMKSVHIDLYFRKGLNKVLKERGLKEI
jgi:RNase P/RNase MRP subunit p30